MPSAALLSCSRPVLFRSFLDFPEKFIRDDLQFRSFGNYSPVGIFAVDDFSHIDPVVENAVEVEA